MVLVNLAQLFIPQIIKQAIDTLRFGTVNRQTLFIQCAIIIGLGFAITGLRYCWRIQLMGGARDLEKGIRNNLFNHILSLDASYYDRAKTGKIMAYAISDIDHVRIAFGFGLMMMVDTILLGGATFAIMMWTHPKLTFFALIPMPVLMIVIKKLGKRMFLMHKTSQESFAQLTELVRESFLGIRIIKVFNFETIITETVKSAATDYFSKNLKRSFISALLRPIIGLFFNLSLLVLLFYGGYLVTIQDLTPGELAALLQYLGILAWPIISIGWMTNLFQRGLASLKRINNLLDSVPEVRSCDHSIGLPDGNQNISVDKINFSYDKNLPILSDITFFIPKGSFVGITGPPGSGKTTLIQLIPRLYNLSSGTICLGKHDISKIDLDSLRSQIALMSQESFLFSGTIRENILLGQTFEKGHIEHIIDVCDLKQTLETMPYGLDTLVGERGVTLSGGQKQRIALARTLILNCPIIILDDPISQIDTHTASKIISRLSQMSTKATVIIVSHRISALAGCDNIYVLKDGQIDHSGTHEVLIQTDRFYEKAYLVQKFEEEHLA